MRTLTIWRSRYCRGKICTIVLFFYIVYFFIFAERACVYLSNSDATHQYDDSGIKKNHCVCSSVAFFVLNYFLFCSISSLFLSCINLSQYFIACVALLYVALWIIYNKLRFFVSHRWLFVWVFIFSFSFIFFLLFSFCVRYVDCSLGAGHKCWCVYKFWTPLLHTPQLSKMITIQFRSNSIEFYILCILLIIHIHITYSCRHRTTDVN